jgi:pimeloyl-ACP methyl ester carboxylesterase
MGCGAMCRRRAGSAHRAVGGWPDARASAALGSGEGMVTESVTHVGADNEFAAVIHGPGAASLPDGGQVAVRRAWVNVPTGGHVSAAIWGKAQPEIVFLHGARRSARAWDEVALAVGRPVVAVDLPGHGRSNWRRDGRYEPRKLAPAVAEAIRSFAPRARLVVGDGLGALTALALAQRHSALLPAVVLVDTLPGTQSRAREPSDGQSPAEGAAPGSRPMSAGEAPQRFATPEAARAALAGRHPGWPDAVLRQEVQTELEAEPDGQWAWRHHPGNLPDAASLAFDDPSLWSELAGLGGAAFLVRGEGSARLTEADLDALGARAPGAGIITVPRATQDLIVAAPAALAAQLLGLLATSASLGQAGHIPANHQGGSR